MVLSNPSVRQIRPVDDAAEETKFVTRLDKSNSKSMLSDQGHPYIYRVRVRNRTRVNVA